MRHCCQRYKPVLLLNSYCGVLWLIHTKFYSIPIFQVIVSRILCQTFLTKTKLVSMQKQYQSFLYAYLLGAFAVLGFAPFYIFPASIISLIGVFYLWFKASTPKAALKLGFVFGLGLYTIGIYWIYISLHTFGGMPWWFASFCTFCLCAFMALFPALVGYFSKYLGFLVITAPVLWGLSDWVRSWIFTGFPWLTLGYSQAPYSPLSGYMPIIGVYGVSIITALIAVLVANWLANQHSSKQHQMACRRNTIITITLTVAVGMVLKIAPWSTPVNAPFKVSLVQGNISQDIKWAPEIAQDTINQYVKMTQASDAKLIILPETAMPVLASQLDSNVKDTLTKHAKKNNGNIIVGMVEYDENTQEYFNSALSYGKSSTQSYSKTHLVPFGEFIPLKKVFGWVYRDWLNIPLSDLSRGKNLTPMQLGDQKVAVNICYEDVFGEEITRMLPEATLLVNISNDAWYGQSYAADQHLQFSQARAIETGRMVLRATNTGATAIIGTDGVVLQHAQHDKTITVNGKAQGYTGSTPYVRWGNWPFIIFSLGAIAFVIRRKKQ